MDRNPRAGPAVDRGPDEHPHDPAERKGLGLRTFSNGGWGECEQLEVILDAYETTGRKEYLTLATQVYNWFYDRVGDTWTGGSRGNYDWFGYDFNDDVMWQIIAVTRLALLTGEAKYRTAAQKKFDLSGRPPTRRPQGKPYIRDGRVHL